MQTETAAKFIVITEARAAGLGIDGGKRVRACAAASFEAAEFAAAKEAGRAVAAEVTGAFWQEVLDGQADERVLREMLNALTH